MPHTHEYDCIVCGAHFDSEDDLARHNSAQHLSRATGMERPRQSTHEVKEDSARKEPEEL